MTVKELKAKLANYDDDLSVFVGIDSVRLQRIDNLWSVEKPEQEYDRFAEWIRIMKGSTALCCRTDRKEQTK